MRKITVPLFGTVMRAPAHAVNPAGAHVFSTVGGGLAIVYYAEGSDRPLMRLEVDEANYTSDMLQAVEAWCRAMCPSSPHLMR